MPRRWASGSERLAYQQKVSWPPERDSSADVWNVSPSSELESERLTFERLTDEGLTLEMSALESLYDGQITLSTLLIKPNFVLVLAAIGFSLLRVLRFSPLLKNQHFQILIRSDSVSIL